jgi:hypothetical protein
MSVRNESTSSESTKRYQDGPKKGITTANRRSSVVQITEAVGKELKNPIPKGGRRGPIFKAFLTTVVALAIIAISVIVILSKAVGLSSVHDFFQNQSKPATIALSTGIGVGTLLLGYGFYFCFLVYYRTGKMPNQ